MQLSSPICHQISRKLKKPFKKWWRRWDSGHSLCCGLRIQSLFTFHTTTYAKSFHRQRIRRSCSYPIHLLPDIRPIIGATANDWCIKIRSSCSVLVPGLEWKITNSSSKLPETIWSKHQGSEHPGFGSRHGRLVSGSQVSNSPSNDGIH